VQQLYKGATGLTLSFAIKNDGVPVDLTGAVVTLKVYSFSTNTLKFSGTCTVDSVTGGLCHYVTQATDFDTVGDYYSWLVVTKTGYAMNYVDNSYKVIQYQASKVTTDELLKFMDIPAENAKPTSTIQMYIDQAQSMLLLEVPALATTTNQDYINIEQKLIMLRSATLYFMNSGESNINPDIRMQKIKMWTEEYKLACDRLNSVLATDPTGSTGVARRSYNISVMASPLDQNYSPYSIADDTNND
jgi:BppU N-terminal domain